MTNPIQRRGYQIQTGIIKGLLMLCGLGLVLSITARADAALGTPVFLLTTALISTWCAVGWRHRARTRAAQSAPIEMRTMADELAHSRDGQMRTLADLERAHHGIQLVLCATGDRGMPAQLMAESLVAFADDAAHAQGVSPVLEQLVLMRRAMPPEHAGVEHVAGLPLWAADVMAAVEQEAAARRPTGVRAAIERRRA